MAEQLVTFTVEAPTTLLPFLLANVKGKSRNNIKSLLSHRQIMVRATYITQFDHPLLPGQTVTVPMTATAAMPKLPFPVIFEDRDLIVINKPAGLLTIATDREKSATVYHMLTDYLRARSPEGRVFVIHRLDRDTSGVVLFAKNEDTKRAFQDDWESLVRVRGYTAVVEGVPEEPVGTVRSFLHETTTHLVYSGSESGGKEAITRYTLMQENGHFALLDVQLDTGRKNQIRVHMGDLGHPVVGDKKYGAHTNPLGRMGLHASELRFRHPVTGVDTLYAAPAPGTFAALLRR